MAERVTGLRPVVAAITLATFIDGTGAALAQSAAPSAKKFSLYGEPTPATTAPIVSDSQQTIIDSVVTSQATVTTDAPEDNNAPMYCPVGTKQGSGSADCVSLVWRGSGLSGPSSGYFAVTRSEAFDAAVVARSLVSRNATLSGSDAAGTLTSRQQVGPFWTALTSSWSDFGTADTRYTLATIGAQAKVSDYTALGFMVQADRQSFVDGVASNDSTGWLAGPYVAAFLPATGMQFQARALWGATDNEISPDGSFTDQYDGRRSLAMVDLSGPIVAGPTSISLHLGAAYSSEKSDAYTDGLSQIIPSQTTAFARSTFGVTYSRQLGATPGETVLSAGLDGNWTNTVSGPEVDYEGGSASALLGISHRFEKGQFGASIFHSGIGNGGMTTTGASLNLALEF